MLLISFNLNISWGALDKPNASYKSGFPGRQFGHLLNSYFNTTKNMFWVLFPPQFSENQKIYQLLFSKIILTLLSLSQVYNDFTNYFWSNFGDKRQIIYLKISSYFVRQVCLDLRIYWTMEQKVFLLYFLVGFK